MKNFTSNSQKIGELGESVACNFLSKHGFVVLERNYTKKWGEIDIVAKKSEMLHFIEVKARSVTQEFFKNIITGASVAGTVRPEDNMHIWKMKRLRRVVETYLISKRQGNVPWQFDLLVVYLDIEKRMARVRVVDNIIL